MNLIRTHHHARIGLRLLLALLLAAPPLWSFALASPATPAGSAVQTQMPCIDGGSDLVHGGQAVPEHDCPHCSGDAPASQCHCAQAPPSALGESRHVTSPRGIDGAPQYHLANDALPDSPDESLYRPPIFHG